MPSNWKYTGGVDVSYGGLFVNLDGSQEHDYLDGIEVVDLESATGADGLILIDFRTLLFFQDKKKIKEALAFCGRSLSDLRGNGKESILMELASSLNAYGHYDPWSDYYRRPVHFCLVYDYGPSSDKNTWDGWTVDKGETVKLHKEYGGNLGEYLEGEWLH